MPSLGSPNLPRIPPWAAYGLTRSEAKTRLEFHGLNELAGAERRGFWRTIGGILAEPVFLLLVVAATTYLVIGDLGEGLLLAFFALLTIGLVTIQERRSERALDALRSLAAPHARVIRDGREQRLWANQVVPGDALLVAEGERIPADAVVRHATS